MKRHPAPARKSQIVRLVDCGGLGPYMINYSRRRGDPLWWAGVATIAYNGWNYLIDQGFHLPELPV